MRCEQKMDKDRKPTIHELEALLESDEELEITILPNGEIRAVDANGEKVEVGDARLKPITMRENLGGEYSARL